MARRLGGILGVFEEADQKEGHKFGRFLRIKVSLDLRKPLLRATVIRYQERAIRIFFKYERLPTFCFSCGRIGHQVKECDEVEEKEGEEYEDLEEREFSFGPWLRASPLPRVTFELKKETSSGNCSRNLFTSPSSNSKADTGSSRKEGEPSVVQSKEITKKGKEIAVEPCLNDLFVNAKDIENVVESLGTVALTPTKKSVEESQSKKVVGKKIRKWTRQKVEGKPKASRVSRKVKELGKRLLMDEDVVEDHGGNQKGGEKKARQDVVMMDSVVQQEREGLEDQPSPAQ